MLPQSLIILQFELIVLQIMSYWQFRGVEWIISSSGIYRPSDIQLAYRAKNSVNFIACKTGTVPCKKTANYKEK